MADSFFDEDDSQLDPNQKESFFSQSQRAPPPKQKLAPRVVVAAPSQEPDFLFESPDAGNVVQKLAFLWMSERGCPEILPFDPKDQLEECLQMLLRQEEAVNSLRTDIENWTEVEHLRLLLVQQDNERIKWLANSYLRCRMRKIEDQHSALMTDHDYKSNLSLEERQYLDRYDTLKMTYFTTLALDTLPEKLRSMTDQPAMIVKPDTEQAVYVMAVRTCGPIDSGDGKSLTLDKDSIHMIRYSRVKHLLAAGDVRLV